MKISKTKTFVLMAEKNMDQKDLAVAAEMSRASLSTIMNGKNCRPTTVYRIAKALNADVTAVIEE